MPNEGDQKTGAAGGEGDQTPPAPTTQNTGPKLEVKDGTVLMDGKKMVMESDLIAAKRSLESASEKAQQAHTEAIDTARLELSAEQKKVAELNAKVTEAQNAPGQGATSDEDVAGIKQELTDALSKVETLTTESGKALELRRQLVVAQYPGVTAESLANKTMQELDSFEEALKAISSSRGGTGPYAVGGGLGQAAPLSEMDRAAKVLENTPVRGVRNAPA